MKKKLLVVLLCVVFLTTGCGKLINLKKDVKTNDYVAPNSQKAKDKSTKKSNCSVLDCMKKLKVENTVEEINKVIGFDGELTNETYKEYTWKFSNTESIKATYYSSDKATIDATYDKDPLRNKKVDFSRYSEIQSALKSTSLTYDEFKEKVGGVEGTLTYISSYSNKYVWVNKNGEYLTGTFSNTTNKCTFVIGRIVQKK